MDDRISALSAQIAELSKKIETVSSGSGGSNWVAEITALWGTVNTISASFQETYNSKIKLIAIERYDWGSQDINFVNPTNRDCIVKIAMAHSEFANLVTSSGETPTFLDRGDSVVKVAYIPLLKGEHLKISGGGTASLMYFHT